MIQLYLCILALCLLSPPSALPPDPPKVQGTLQITPDSLDFLPTGVGYYRYDTLLVGHPSDTGVNVAIELLPLLKLRQEGLEVRKPSFRINNGNDNVPVPIRFAPDSAGAHGAIAKCFVQDSAVANNDSAFRTIAGDAVVIPRHFPGGTVDFGAVPVDSISNRYDTLHLPANDTLSATIVVLGYSLAGDITSFSIDTNISRPDTINALHRNGAPLGVRFHPRAAVDTTAATLTVRTNFGSRTILLRGGGISSGIQSDSLTLDPVDSIHFDTVLVGGFRDRRFRITNNESRSIDVAVSIANTSHFFLTDTTRAHFTLQSGDTHLINVRFQPQDTGDLSAIANVSSQGFVGNIRLLGQGISRRIVVERDSTPLTLPYRLNFTVASGRIGDTIALTIRNTGSETLQLRSSIGGDDANLFTDSLGTSLAPRKTGGWQIRFRRPDTPAGPLPKSAYISLTDRRDTSIELAHINLFGNIGDDTTVTSPHDSLAISALEIDFGAVAISTSDTLSITLRNHGTTVLRLADAGFDAFQSVFRVLSFPDSLAPLQSGQVLISYSPAATSADTVGWRLRWGTGDSIALIKLTGRGTQRRYAIAPASTRVRVGEPFKLPVMFSPAPATGINWDSVVISLDPASLYLRDVEPVPGQTLQFERRNNDSLILIRRASGDLPGGTDRLFTLDLIGLTSGVPHNDITIVSATMLDAFPVTISSAGSITLEGCDIGKTFDFSEKAAIRAIVTDPTSAGATLIYTAPQGAAPSLRLIGMAGTEVMALELPGGTGNEQRIHLSLAGAPLGFYMLEIRVDRDRTSTPIMITR